MERQIFLLKTPKPFRHHLKLFVSDGENKTFQTIVTFTTEHKVPEKERVNNARKHQAEYSTNKEEEIDALYRDSGYGITFTHKDDPEGKRKKESFKLTPIDAERVALRNLFAHAGLEFDGSKDVKVLDMEYRKFIEAKSGAKIEKSTATHIPHNKVDVVKSMQDQMLAAHAKYKEVYGESIPSGFENDLTLLDGISSEGFDVKAYIAEHSNVEDESDVETIDPLPADVEKLQELYFAEFGTKPSNSTKNNAGWLQSKIAEKRAQG